VRAIPFFEQREIGEQSLLNRRAEVEAERGNAFGERFARGGCLMP
jgi:hypothetical protein